MTLLEPVPELAELPVLPEPSLELLEPDKPEPLLDPLESDEPDEPEPLLDVVDTVATVAVDFVFVASAGSLPVTSVTVITSQAATNRATAPPTTRRRSARARAARLAFRLDPLGVASAVDIER